MNELLSTTSVSAIIRHWDQTNIAPENLPSTEKPDPLAYLLKLRRLTSAERELASIQYDGDDQVPWYGVFSGADGSLQVVCDDLKELLTICEENGRSVQFNNMQ